MAKYNDMFNDKYTYLDLHLMFESALEDAQDALEIEHDFEELTNAELLALTEVYCNVEEEFYDKYGWKEEFIAQCEDVHNYDYHDDDFVCLGDNILCGKHCNDCPCAHPVGEFI